MRAIVQRRYGSPEDLRLEEVPPPVPDRDEVVIRMRAASVHPDVWHVVVGRPAVLRVMGAGLVRPRNPIPGTDVAGVVESVGEDVKSLRSGEAVFGETIGDNQWTNGGAYAELVVAPASNLERKPENVSFEEAACVPTSGFITLLNLGGAGEVWNGQRVLINGAAGGAGSLALQIAKAAGATVTAVDHGRKLDLLRRLGADEVIDYRQEDFTETAERYDLILDVPGNRPLSAVVRVLEADGRYVPIGHDRFGADGRSVLGLLPHFLGLAVRAKLGHRHLGVRRRAAAPAAPRLDKRQIIRLLRDWLADGTIRPVVDRVFPLAEAAEAIRYLALGEALGRVVIASRS